MEVTALAKAWRQESTCELRKRQVKHRLQKGK